MKRKTKRWKTWARERIEGKWYVAETFSPPYAESAARHKAHWLRLLMDPPEVRVLPAGQRPGRRL
jgi:hypothetical protein